MTESLDDLRAEVCTFIPDAGTLARVQEMLERAYWVGWNAKEADE